MRDKIKLTVIENGGRSTDIEHFRSYEVDADLYQAADAFSMELANPELDICEGWQCKLYVNDQLALSGVIDTVSSKCDKSGQTLKISGRDLMGLVVDQYCQSFDLTSKTTLKALAEQLLSGVPLINVKAIRYEKPDAASIEEDMRLIASPGQQVFEVLKDFSRARGLLFYNLPSGEFVFGRPQASGPSLYKIIFNKSGGKNNAMSGERVSSCEKRYKKIIVYGQLQGEDNASPQDASVRYEYVDPDTAFTLNKVFVSKDTSGQRSLKKCAQLIAARQRFEALKLSYTVPGHSQNGRVWDINQLCDVEDGINKVKAGQYLVYGRTFKLDKDNGPTTELRLGLPGVVL
ncbi:MAG TPA: hypothetical protein PLL10_02010 [Elusimicrobiales bacterium]|nr:hypothetical protein [Elusimicrobiales bacterium]